MFHEYEIVFIIRPDLDEAETKAAIERIETSVTETGGQVLERDEWGLRKLAYLIGKYGKGHYVLLNAVSQPESILEIERKMRLDDRVIRFLTVKLDDAVDVDALVATATEKAKMKAELEAQKAAEAAEAAESTDSEAAEA